MKSIIIACVRATLGTGLESSIVGEPSETSSSSSVNKKPACGERDIASRVWLVSVCVYSCDRRCSINEYFCLRYF